MIEMKDYKYKELCEAMDEKIKTGKSKQLQLKNWKRFFEWENPTSQIYRITMIYDIPKEKEDGRKKNGGLREGAGAKVKVQEEFEMIFQKYLYDELRKNEYYRNSDYQIYFNNDGICKYFGIYKDIYEALRTDKEGKLIDKELDTLAYAKIADKLREKSRSWILNKMEKAKGVILGYGIIIHCGSYYNYDYDNSLLKLYDEAQQHFLENNKFKSVKDVIDTGMWNTMLNFIREEILEGYKEDGVLPDEYKRWKKIKKYHKLTVEPEITFDNISLDYDNVKKMRKSLNEKVIQEVYMFFLKYEKEIHIDLFGDQFDEKSAMQKYTYILEKYVRLEESESSSFFAAKDKYKMVLKMTYFISVIKVVDIA